MLNCRTEFLIGKEACIKLHKTKIAVIGLGGVGSYVVEALGRTGIGTLMLVDFDTISVSNINRQIIALNSTIGQRKIDVMERRLLDINPQCQIFKLQQFVDATSIFSLNFHSLYRPPVGAWDVGASRSLSKLNW